MLITLSAPWNVPSLKDGFHRNNTRHCPELQFNFKSWPHTYTASSQITNFKWLTVCLDSISKRCERFQGRVNRRAKSVSYDRIVKPRQFATRFTFRILQRVVIGLSHSGGKYSRSYCFKSFGKVSKRFIAFFWKRVLTERRRFEQIEKG